MVRIAVHRKQPSFGSLRDHLDNTGLGCEKALPPQLVYVCFRIQCENKFHKDRDHVLLYVHAQHYYLNHTYISSLVRSTKRATGETNAHEAYGA